MFTFSNCLGDWEVKMDRVRMNNGTPRRDPNFGPHALVETRNGAIIDDIRVEITAYSENNGVTHAFMVYRGAEEKGDLICTVMYNKAVGEVRVLNSIVFPYETQVFVNFEKKLITIALIYGKVMAR